MRSWLGEPEQFADPKFDTIAARYGASQEINVLIAELFATKTMDELVTSGQSRGVPIAAVLSPAETLGSDHFRSVGALTTAEFAHHRTANVRLTLPLRELPPGQYLLTLEATSGASRAERSLRFDLR